MQTIFIDYDQHCIYFQLPNPQKASRVIDDTVILIHTTDSTKARKMPR